MGARSPDGLEPGVLGPGGDGGLEGGLCFLDTSSCFLLLSSLSLASMVEISVSMSCTVEAMAEISSSMSLAGLGPGGLRSGIPGIKIGLKMKNWT